MNHILPPFKNLITRINSSLDRVLANNSFWVAGIIFFIWLSVIMLGMHVNWSHFGRIILFIILVGSIFFLSSRLSNIRHNEYLIGVLSVIVSIIGYYLFSPFIDHTESIFFLATIAISARWGTKPGLMVSILSSLGLVFILNNSGVKDVSTTALTIGGFLFFSALIVGSITLKRERALNDQLIAQQQVQETYSATLMALTQALETRDLETQGHSDRVTSLSLTIAKEMAISSKEVQQIHWGALLHDVGKIGIPDHILRKPGPLNEEEWAVMKKHPDIGYDMLKDIQFLQPALNIVHDHHERFDGKGYPQGLKGKDIPLAARIFSIVDSYDAMTSDRPYRKKMSSVEALNELRKCSGSQFDPEIVKIFIKKISS